MKKSHRYETNLQWTGNSGKGTEDYKAYQRNYKITIDGKPAIAGSSDPNFRGDPERYNPEEMLVASLSACHMLWYLHLCSEAGVVVEEYQDHASGTMEETAEGGGRFSRVTLSPHIVVKDEAMIRIADTLHEKANKMCFIANSCNFPVEHKPTYAFKNS